MLVVVGKRSSGKTFWAVEPKKAVADGVLSPTELERTVLHGFQASAVRPYGIA